MHWLKALLRAVFFVPITLILLFEEWGWEPLSRLFARLARLRLWAWTEGKISRLPPWASVLAFGVPALALLPVKLLALYLFGKGKATLGLILLVAAKLLGTAILARLFQLTQPALMQLPWFARWYPRWKTWKDAWLERVRQSRTWRAARRWKTALRGWIR